MGLTVEIDISIEEEAWEHYLKDTHDFSFKVIESVLRSLSDKVNEPVEIALLLSGNEALQDLNRSWRGKDSPTNVLSFPASRDFPPYPGQPRFLGDIAISIDMVISEAEDQRKSVEHHIAHLLIHGTLHLLGFDHETDDEATEMENLEIELLNRLNIPNPYQNKD